MFSNLEKGDYFGVITSINKKRGTSSVPFKKIGGDLHFHRSLGSRAQRKLAFFAEMQGRRQSQQVQYHRRCEA